MFPTAIRVMDVDALLRSAREAVAGGGQPAAAGRPGAGEPGSGAGRTPDWNAFLRCYSRGDGGFERELGRYIRLLEAYRAAFGRSEVAIVRAPGRVNIIGEHTDYNGGPVLPAAIDRDIAAVFAPRGDSAVRVRDARSELGEREFSIVEEIAPFAPGNWGNYVKAAAQEIVRRRLAGGRLRGVDAVVHGTIPAAAGLSSSSALVVLSAVMLLAANRIELTGEQLAELATEAERYVGTRGGGMDQTACVRAEDGAALFIDFATGGVRPIAVPAGYTLVIAHSMVNAPKSGAARDSYNLRAGESRIAGELFRRQLEAQLGRALEENRIGALRFYREELGAETFDALVGRTFHEASYSIEEIASLLDLSPADVRASYHLPGGESQESGEAAVSAGGTGLANDPSAGGDRAHRAEPSAGGYKLCRRFRHVLEESLRVEQLAAALEGARMHEVGELMNESHRSCRDLYEISRPELDELVEIERQAGALGARMTGAGFGGCTVYLVESDEVDASMDEVIEHYYRRARGVEREDWSDLIFPVRMVGGVSALR